MKLIIVLTKEVADLDEAQVRANQLKQVIPDDLQVNMTAKVNTVIEPQE